MKRSGKFVAAMAGASTLVLAAQAGVEHWGTSRIDAALASMAGPGATVTRKSVSVDPWYGRARVEGLDVAFRDGTKVSVGSMLFPTGISLLATAQAAENLSFDNIAVSNEFVSVDIKRADVTGSSASRADVLAVFDTASTVPLSTRIAKLTAEGVSVPEIRIRAKFGEGATLSSTSMVYRDLRIAGITNGVIRSAALSGADVESRLGEKNSGKGTYGAMAMTEVDLGLIARFLLEPAGPEDTGLKVAYGSWSQEAFGTTDSTGARSSIRAATAKNVRLRPTTTPIIPLIREFAAKKTDNLDQADQVRLVTAIADIYDGVDFGTNELVDLEFKTPPGADEVVVKVPRVSFASGQAVGASAAKPSEFRIDGLDITAKDGFARIGSITNTGWSYRPIIEALRKASADGTLDPASFDPRAFIPQLGTLTMRDMEINVPDSIKPKSERIKLGVKSLEIATSDQLNGIPTAARFAVDRLTMALSPKNDNDGFKELLALGYKDIDLSTVFDIRWIESTSELTLGQFGIEAVNAGSVGLRGRIGNMGKEIFTGDPQTAQMALLGATLKEARLVVENKGLFERILDREAKKQNKKPDQLRRELATVAQMGVPMMLGNSDAAKVIGAAVGKFVAKPTRLTVTAKARTPGGLGLAEVMGAGGDPGEILGLLDVTASND